MATEEEFEYSDDEIENSGIFRWLQAAVVLFALGGFFGLAWYAYKSGEGTDDKDVELVKVENEPVKEAPANPGGMQIPNQDKTVYGLINGNKQEKPVVERIMPSTEEPEHDTATGTWTNGKGRSADTTASANADVPPIKELSENGIRKAQQFNPSKNKAAAAPSTPNIAIAQTPTPISEPIQPKAVPLQQQAQAPSTPVTEAKEKPIAVGTNDTPAPAPVQKEAAPTAEEEKPAPTAAPAANMPKIRIQLGALKSEAEAESTWSKITGKYSDTLGDKQHYIVRVNVNGNTFYRLQAAPFSSTQDANAACMTLVSGGQACILARGK